MWILFQRQWYWTQEVAWGSSSSSSCCSIQLVNVKHQQFIHIHSFHWHVQNATFPCRSQELLPFLSVTYFSLPPFSTNYSSILSHLILPSISWSTSQSCCSQILQCVPLATEPGISLVILPLMRILQRLQTHTTDTLQTHATYTHYRHTLHRH